MVDLTIVDHTDPEWATRFARLGRENGAHTYSRDIVAHHIPAWREELDRAGIATATIGTCGTLDRTPTARTLSGDLAIQYLHEYHYDRPTDVAERITATLGAAFARILFVTPYQALVHQLQSVHIAALWVPQTVDARAIRAAVPAPHVPALRHAIWYGNVTPARVATHRDVTTALRVAGWTVHTISESRFNDTGPILTQAQAWEISTGYQMGIAVGRAALELMALRVPVMVAGANMGGIVTDEIEWAVQDRANWGGQAVTYSRLPRVCADNIDRAIRGRTNDIPLALAAIDGCLGSPTPAQKTRPTITITDRTQPEPTGYHGLLLCRQGPNEELRYALRSLETNCPWLTDLTLVGGAPDWYTGPLIPTPQTGTRYVNTTTALTIACQDNQDLPETVVMLHDDQFAIRPTANPPTGHRGRIVDVIAEFRAQGITNSAYIKGMQDTLELLRRWGYDDPLSYELHLPMVINRALMGEVLHKISLERVKVPHKRSIYGNVARLGGRKRADVKIRTRDDNWPATNWISTDDNTYTGPIATKLATMFPNPSRWETSEILPASRTNDIPLALTASERPTLTITDRARPEPKPVTNGYHAVIPCRTGPNQELQFALRAIATNCPWVTDVTVYGTPPDWYTGRYVPVLQDGNKHTNTTRALHTIAHASDLPDTVVLWNDDFYAVQPTTRAPDANLGPLANKIDPRIRRNPQSAGTATARGAYETLQLLHRWGFENPLCYEVHAPMSIHRPTLAIALARLVCDPIRIPHKRSIYGNVAGLRGETWATDVKIHTRRDRFPTGPWASTSNTSWYTHHGRRIRALFPNPSPWET